MEPEGPKQQANDPGEVEDLELIMIANAKKAGLTLGELNEFRVRDFIKFINIYTGAEKQKPRQATQEDIDRFFRR